MISFFNRKKDYQNFPEYWKNYLSLFPKDISYKKNIDETRFVVIDIETTGLNVKKDKMLSIGALTITGNEIDVQNTLEIYIEQEKSNSDSIPIHGIIGNAGNNINVIETEAVKLFVEYAGNSILVGHNINFDISFINQVLKRGIRDTLRNKYVDTFTLYHRITKGERITKRQSSLDSLCEEFNISSSDRHTALGDAYITGVLFLKILTRLKKRGVETLGDLLKDRSKIL